MFIDLPETERMKEFRLNQERAETNERKGKHGGDCNVTQCQKPGASSYNHAMRAYYCEACAEKLNANAISYGEEPFCDVVPDHTYKYRNTNSRHRHL